MRKVTKCALSCWLAATGAAVIAMAQNRTTIQVPIDAPQQVAIVTFDPAKASAPDVRHWMKLANNAYYSRPVGEPAECTKSPDLQKLERLVEDNRKLVDELGTPSYPPELSGIVLYLKHLQSFWLWRIQQELRFAQDGDTPELEWDNFDANDKCSATVEQLRDSRGTMKACRLVFFDWANCTNKVFLDQMGPYPMADWEAFLRAYDLRVRIISTEGDEGFDSQL